jgi:uncharacterized protein (TIGR02996 family)
MTDGDALYRAILAHPDDDTARLVYADWLDENGEADRAEFIRVQIELTRAPTLTLRLREKVLLALHGEEWLAQFKVHGGPLQGETHGGFRRGFVEVVWMPAAEFVRRAEPLFTRLPVRELRVTRTSLKEFELLVQCPDFARLDTLDLSEHQLGDQGAAVLAHSAPAHQLNAVRLRGCNITDQGALLLASTPFESLLRELASWPLRELDVSHNPISQAGLAALRRRYGAAVRAEGMRSPG